MGNSHGTQVSDEERRRYIRQMDAQMNQRFGRTSKHAVKVVVRGERETGKTTLTKLLSGGVFDPKYTQSKPGEVETVTVQWGAGPGEDVSLSMVAVAEIDTRKQAEEQGGASLKISHEEKNRFSRSKKTLQDAMAKHYEGCQGVIVMVDPGKEWTFSHAKDILECIPENLEILLIANFKDQEQSWVTPRDAMLAHVAGTGRHVHFCECCLANMYGMPAVEAFLHICLWAIKTREYEELLDKSDEDMLEALKAGRTIAKEQDYSAYPFKLSILDSSPADLGGPSMQAAVEPKNL
eukprot:CAMPEP_0177717526 /NCGR_PEP_ID=MMETSP0484_2-20121128/15091_1 /TAXON_ID=354590 /ORGANISM="Rhodomonas lens, Strain RHODO" /LENGTH=292 /DNA_ID=CAMNT_0019229631 /DNA_START=169 /DNA_END=1044 /DNA_ORIENTATION=+